ncbi:MAG: type IV secretion protein IcmB, partial [Gammaproteobacteria bacterium]|nr:type IV secretion protein IcmB [Gammaproteobacteria bacterium]
MNPMSYLLDMFDTLLSWVSMSVRQTTHSYCVLETAEDQHTLVAKDGSLLTIVRLQGVNGLVGEPEFAHLHRGICQSLMTSFSRLGHSVQCVFSYDKEAVREEIKNILLPARQTAQHLDLALSDLLDERENNLSLYCGQESVFFVLWTRPYLLTNDQVKGALRDKQKSMKANAIPPFKDTQNLIAAIPDLKNAHDSFVRSFYNDLSGLGLQLNILPVHEALKQVRMSIDSLFTDKHWSPCLPGDKIPERASDRFPYDISNVMYPTLADQLFVRDGERIDLRTVRIGDLNYSSVFIYLFPREVQSFTALLRRTLPTHIPWRISFLIESKGATSVTSFKKTVAAILSFTSNQNRLLHDSIVQLQETELNGEDAVVRLRVAAATWAPADDLRLLRTRTAQLAKAIQGWGSCDVTELSGDPFSGAASSMLAVYGSSDATASLAPLADVVYMLPFTRPASQWRVGAILFRSPDGKPWPYHPGSTQQTTWIDLLYARPGSGKSVLSNAINLALCLSSGLKRLPRIAIVDIGPSSSGLISLIREALPKENQHWVQYHRLSMTPEYAINPFDTQLGCRYPTSQDRSFLVNFLTLLVTPLGVENPYDAMADMAGMVVDELYKSLAEGGNPYTYTPGLELIVDSI